jgi:hypothetical protein
VTAAAKLLGTAIEAATATLARAKAARTSAEGLLLEAEGVEADAERELAELHAAAAILTPEDDGPVIEPAPAPKVTTKRKAAPTEADIVPGSEEDIIRREAESG